MKTLDETIKYIYDKQGCFYCRYRGEDCANNCFLENVIYYLQEYREKQEMLAELIRYYSQHMEDYKQATRDLKDNHQLTWNELCEMKDEPVWILRRDLYESDWWGYYHIVSHIDDDVLYTNNGGFDKYYLGRTWKAYRKKK